MWAIFNSVPVLFVYDCSSEKPPLPTEPVAKMLAPFELWLCGCALSLDQWFSTVYLIVMSSASRCSEACPNYLIFRVSTIGLCKPLSTQTLSFRVHSSSNRPSIPCLLSIKICCTNVCEKAPKNTSLNARKIRLGAGERRLRLGL